MASQTQSLGQSSVSIEDEPILKIKNVSKKFGNFYALQNVSLAIPRKAIALLIGPNGSGKTTLINCITGIYIPDEGEIIFDGRNITGLPIHETVKLGLGRSFQIPQPFMRMTVAENLLLCGQNNPGENFLSSINRKNWRDFERRTLERMHKVLRVIGLDDKADNLACELSGGQLKLLELGRLLMLNSKMMLLDEPIGGVNPVLANSIFSHIVNIRNEFGTSFLIIEHRLDIAMKYVDLVYVLSRGNVVASGTPEEIVEKSELYEVYLV
ncbi:MAG: ABC transporter ATP-binding protein [Nitrososphaerota archaeon]